MERAHVLVRLRDGSAVSCAAGICRTSATTVRLEHSDMSPGVASITFEQVFDVGDSNSRVFQTSLTGAIDSVIDGRAATLIATGAASSGKSFACHGDQHKPRNGKAEPGLITLAIRRVFSCLEAKLQEEDKCNVLLSCWGVAQSGTSKSGALTDLLAAGKSVDSLPMGNMEEVLVEHSVVVSTPAEAVHLYSRALSRVKDAEQQDFVFALHVETLTKNGEAKRGRFLVVDIHGGSVIEPRGGEVKNQDEKKERGQQYFLDTQFPVHKTLSTSFGEFVGNTSATYLLVAIQTPAQFQQQAIQSLLYACKAKEIKSTTSVNCSSAFVERGSPNQLQDMNQRPRKTENQTPGCDEDHIVPAAPSMDRRAASFPDRPLPPMSPPLSTTSSDSTCDVPFFTPLYEAGQKPVRSPTLSPSTSIESEESRRQTTVSRRVRKAYELAKAATISPVKQSAVFAANSNQSDEGVAHDAMDRLLKHLPRDTLCGLTLQAKLEQIRSNQLELERALAHEVSIKDKCVDRISRLSQTMSCQVVEHEQQLQEALTAKHAAETKLQDLNLKFDDVGREVTRLQEEIMALKAGQQISVIGDGTQSENERTMLHTLSARLEEAMIQAKDVITFKDGVIQALEERLQLASKRGADAVTLLETEKARFDREKSALLVQLQESKEGSNKKTNEEISKVQAENTAIQQQKAELTVKLAQLTLELETARSQWAQDARDREDRADQKCAKQVAQAEQQLEQAAAAMQQQMAQFRNELDMKVIRQRVATQVACKAGELKCDQLERDLQRMKLKLAKQKMKMEKKTRALVANAHKQHEEPAAALQHELDDLAVRMKTVLEREQKALRRAKKSEDATQLLQAEMQQIKLSAVHRETAVEREQAALRRARKSEEAVLQLQGEVQELQASVAESERERAAMGNLCKELATDKDALKVELERRIREMEQSIAKQIMEAEARIHEARDVQVQKLVEQHNAELSRVEAAAKHQEMTTLQSVRPTRQQSSTSVSSRASLSEDDGSLSSDSNRQQNIDDLDALIDSKERRYMDLEKRKKAGRSARSSSSSPPTKSSSSLKRALARKEDEVAELSSRQKQLFAALATANEQETLAKKHMQETEVQRQNELARYEDLLQQLNSVKQENWHLSLALQVTESTNQQRQRRPSQTNAIY